jgi:hypothetical protein
VVGDDGVEGGLEELHWSAGPGGVFPVLGAGEGGAAVVGLDFADGARMLQSSPGQMVAAWR